MNYNSERRPLFSPGNTPYDWYTPQYRMLDIVDEAEYQYVHAIADGDYHSGILGIKMLENRYLYDQFLCNFEMAKSYKSDTTVEMLLHDTPLCNLHSIAIHNLNKRFIRRTKFGKGVSFCWSPEYANRHSSKSCMCDGFNCAYGTRRVMIAADVIIGNCHPTYYSANLPKPGYDTTCSSNYQVYVKYGDNEFYPRYFIFYMTKPQ